MALMPMSIQLRSYLKLEEAMQELDAAGDPTADAIRDLMDPLWYRLTDEEHKWLDERTMGPSLDPELLALLHSDAASHIANETVAVLQPMVGTA